MMHRGFATLNMICGLLCHHTYINNVYFMVGEQTSSPFFLIHASELIDLVSVTSVKLYLPTICMSPSHVTPSLS